MTYKTLADVMDALRPEMLAAYRKGDFPRASAPVFAEVAAETSGSAR